MLLRRQLPVALGLVLGMAGCGLDASGGDRAAPRDEGPDLLYRDFLDGKLDGAGHPIGATVFEAEDACGHATGYPLGEHLDLDPRYDDPGRACAALAPELGRGTYVVNVRAALRTPCTDAECGPVLEVRALGAAGQVLASRAVRSEDFRTDDTFENVALTFRVDRPHAVRVEVDYTGFGAVVLDYVEVFRQGRQVVLSPVSGVLDGDAELRIEIVDPPDDHMIRLRCDGIALDERFAEMLADGVAREELTDFRRILTAPAGALLEGCADDTQVVVSLLRGFWTMEIREVRYTAEAVPCAYEGEGETRVLVTGFVPFPAGADQHNSSMEAVLGFDPGTVPSARVMRMILPVEFDNAAAIVADAVARCAPEVVVGFGQGRDRVDLESTAYNRRDTSDVFGGLPDNRGLVVEPAPIRAEGPAVFATELPVDVIEADLRDADVAVAQSDDPGRYVCNDIFYSFGTDAGAESRTTGFIHMPYVRHVDAERREELASVVSTVVRRTVQARSGALIRR